MNPPSLESLALALSSAASLALPPSAQAPPPADPARDRLTERIPELLRRHRIAGLAVAVVRDGELAWAEGFGHADVETERPVAAETVFNAGSISKAVTAWGVLHLVEEERLDLDTPVASYLTRWTLPESEFDVSGVTARRLLSHTAGLTMHSIPGFESSLELPPPEAILQGEYEDSVYTDEGTPVELFAEPGSVWSYSGGGFVLLELVVEERTLEAFPEFMQREVLDPLGMTSSRYGWRPELTDRAAVPYSSRGRAYPTYRFSGSAGAGLYTTVTDLARFAAAGLESRTAKPGRGVLEPATFASMIERTRLPGGAPTPCGLAYFLSDPKAPDAELREANHSGSNFGWQSLMVSLPDDGAALVILSNSDHAGTIFSELVCTWGRLEVDAKLSSCP